MEKQKEKLQYFYVINVKLKSKKTNQDLKPSDYTRLFNAVYIKRIHESSSNTKHCILKNLFTEKDENGKIQFLNGILAQFTYIENEKWFDIEALDIDEEFKIPNGLFPDTKMTEYIFIPNIHRFAYKTNSNFYASPYTIKKISRNSFE
ncbi:MAG: DUF4747 family protein [Bacteroidia bacterium]|nr:DUF4747 family protein [Bacteroidia bacterium]